MKQDIEIPTELCGRCGLPRTEHEVTDAKHIVCPGTDNLFLLVAKTGEVKPQ